MDRGKPQFQKANSKFYHDHMFSEEEYDIIAEQETYRGKKIK